MKIADLANEHRLTAVYGQVKVVRTSHEANYHYLVCSRINGVEIPVAGWLSQTLLPDIEALYTAFKHVTMWIRPLIEKNVYVDPFDQRDAILDTLGDALIALTGKHTPPPPFCYNDYRVFEHDGLRMALLSRVYDPGFDVITTTVSVRPCTIEEATAFLSGGDRTLPDGDVGMVNRDFVFTTRVRQTSPDLDPGDFITNTWLTHTVTVPEEPVK